MGYSETYTYDQNHDMVKKVDRNGNAVNYTYDGLHRVLTEKTKGVNNSWTYGLTGGVLTEANDNAAKTYTYNNQGLPNAETVKIGNDSFKINRYYDSSKLEHLTYQYRAEGNMYKKSEVYNSCTTTTTYDYDGTGRLVSENLVSDNEVSKIAYTYYTYDKKGNQTKIDKYSKNNAGTFKLGMENALYNGSSGIEKFTYNGLNKHLPIIDNKVAVSVETGLGAGVGMYVYWEEMEAGLSYGNTFIKFKLE